MQAPAISFSPDQVSTCGDAAQQMEAALLGRNDCESSGNGVAISVTGD